MAVLRRIRKKGRRKGHIHIGAALTAPITGDRRQKHEHTVSLRRVGVLIDAATAEDNATIRFGDLLGEALNIASRNVSNTRRPIRRVALIIQEISPFLPAFNPILTVALIMQLQRKDMLRHRQTKRHICAGTDAVPAICFARSGAKARINNHRLGAVFNTPIVDHPEIDWSGFSLVVTYIKVHSSATNILIGITIAAAVGPLRHLIGDVFASSAKWVSGLEIGRAPHLTE